MKEQDLEDFLATNPYLIDPSFAGLRPVQQLASQANRLDLMFCKKSGNVILELKRDEIHLPALQQLDRYVRQWSGKCKLARTHYLVGREPSDLDSLRQFAGELDFRVRFRFLGLHIPLRLIYDQRERLYLPYSEELAAIPERYGPVIRWDA